jgi:Secretion system C-terminal sorting domain
MKAFFLLLNFFFLTSFSLFAQVTGADLDINNVRAHVLTQGDMFWNPNTQSAAYEFPKGSGKMASFAAALWIGGYDVSSNQLKVAAQTYRQTGTDYWAGPLDSNGSISPSQSAQWDKIWKINKTDIDSFLSLSIHTTANTPGAILDWPAKGNPYATDATSSLLTITTSMAPFVDVNSDGNYNPLQGDYPKIKGEQTLWWVFNDKKQHTETGSEAIGLQIKGTAFACASIPQLNNVTYYSYEIACYSTSQLDSCIISFWNDIDVGYGFNDYIGFDSVRRMGIGYNGTVTDPSAIGYGTNHTQTGVILLKAMHDTMNIIEPVGAFSFYNNTQNSNYGNPSNLQHYYNLMNATWLNGAPFRKSCNSIDSTAPVTKYVFPDDPSIVGGMSEKQCNNVPDDRRFILSTQPFYMIPGQDPTIFEVAVINTDLGSNNDNFTALRSLADFVIANPDGCENYIPTSNLSTAPDKELTIFPNPAQNEVQVFWQGNKNVQLKLYNTIGELVEVKKVFGNSTLFNTTWLSKGIYFLEISIEGKQTTKKLVIQ